MKFFAIIALGLAAVAAAAPAPQLDCTRDGFFCEPCVNGKRQCVACADGTGLGLVQDFKTWSKKANPESLKGFTIVNYLLKSRGASVDIQDRTLEKYISKN
ncbi:hypothetical protein CEP52_008450 [Fusarium oligoseptatum]|uniref:Uncharacterized protein n=1 Tax=Fusarium oligoseptatum TaxID=2604345 RepID=A0A428THN4_9HYPO|nr:hypothetical protein CEP52_008450 [Fusarium oligoseptatum]